MGIFSIFRKKEKNSNSVILKTAQQKMKEEKIKKEKRRCPVCGNDPYGGRIIVGLGRTDGIYNYQTCSHCNTDYKYKK